MTGSKSISYLTSTETETKIETETIIETDTNLIDSNKINSSTKGKLEGKEFTLSEVKDWFSNFRLSETNNSKLIER